MKPFYEIQSRNTIITNVICLTFGVLILKRNQCNSFFLFYTLFEEQVDVLFYGDK